MELDSFKLALFPQGGFKFLNKIVFTNRMIDCGLEEKFVLRTGYEVD